MPVVSPEKAAKVRTIKAAHATTRGFKLEDATFWGGQQYRPGVKLDLARGRLITESFKQTDGQPWAIRKAKALAHYLENCPLFLPEGQRLCGAYTSAENTVPFTPEKFHRWVKNAVHGGALTSLVDEKDVKEFDEIIDWWSKPGRTEWDKEREAMPDWLNSYRVWDGTFQWSQYEPAQELTMDLVFGGANARIKVAEQKLEELSNTLPSDYVHRKTNLEAMIIALNAAKVYGHRYADFCRDLAAKEKDPVRKAQLEEMAVTNDRVPAESPRTFHEALQACLTANCIRNLEEPCEGVPSGRFDIMFRPYWEKDKKAGRITKDEGIELTKWFLLKHAENSTLYSPLVNQAYGGAQRLQNICIGGVDKDGKDVTCDLTYMVMDASMSMHLNEPELALRVHPGTPREVILKALDCIEAGLTFPSFHNDTTLIPLGLRYGIPIEDARDYYVPFCVTHVIAGKNQTRYWPGWMSLPKVFWWALNSGKNPETGQQRGAITTDPLTWKGYEDMLNAYAEQLRFFADKQSKLENLCHQNYNVYQCKPYSSAFAEDSLERGLMEEEWQYPYEIANNWPLVGPVNVADSMAAIKKYVFDDKKVKMSDLIDAINKNWEGYEELRKLMLSAPKYGNDDDYVDLIANDVQVTTTQVIESFKDYYGCPWHPNGSNAATVYSFALDCNATPDGRRRGDMLADGTLSPQLGVDKKGSTAVLRSCAKTDPLKTYSHLLNQKLSPGIVKGDVGREAFYSYIKTWMEMGISHIQFNMVNKEILLDAQKHPEKHQDLIIRVAGYSAYFIDLIKGMQDSIIARTEQTSM